jgi:hypothetical protein
MAAMCILAGLVMPTPGKETPFAPYMPGHIFGYLPVMC